jgi:hypothetical protein
MFGCFTGFISHSPQTRMLEASPSVSKTCGHIVWRGGGGDVKGHVWWKMIDTKFHLPIIVNIILDKKLDNNLPDCSCVEDFSFQMAVVCKKV